RSHKDKLKNIDDEEEENKKKDDKKDGDDNDDDDDHTDYASIKDRVIVFVTTTPASTSTQDHSKPSFSSSIFFQEETMEEMHENIINKVPDLTVLKTNELIEEALPRLVINVVKQERKSSRAVVSGLRSKEFVENAPKIIEELFRIQMQDTVLNVYPTTSALTSTTTTYDLQHHLYLKMKTDLPSQVADPELWEILRAKFEKSSTSTGPCQTDAFR
ncbi:hypothetical protein Tco_0160557, partial [Tanacetum coccineum]